MQEEEEGKVEELRRDREVGMEGVTREVHRHPRGRDATGRSMAPVASRRMVWIIGGISARMGCMDPYVECL